MDEIVLNVAVQVYHHLARRFFVFGRLIKTAAP